MSHLWKKVQVEMENENYLQKKINIILVPSQRYQDFRYLLQSLKVPRNLIGYNNYTQRFTHLNYLSSPLVGKKCLNSFIS